MDISVVFRILVKSWLVNSTSFFVIRKIFTLFNCSEQVFCDIVFLSTKTFQPDYPFYGPLSPVEA